MNYLSILASCYANPLILILWILIEPKFKELKWNTSEHIDTNTSIISLPKYIIFCTLFFPIWTLGQFYIIYFNTSSSYWYFLNQNTSNPWMLLCYIPSIITLKVYTSKSGMEGNIMGFIFFPMLFISSIGIIVYHLIWLSNII